MTRRKAAAPTNGRKGKLVGWAILAAIIGVIALLQHCFIPTGPIRAAWGELVYARTATTIGPPDLGPPPWRVIQLWVDRRFLREAHRADTTVHIEVYDCRSRESLTVDDAYLEGVSTNLGQLRAGYREKLAKAPPRVRLEVFVSETVIMPRQEVCLRVTGGSMLGARIVGQGRRMSSRGASTIVRPL